MTLLLDQNISHGLVAGLQHEFPGTAHVRDFKLERADDFELWKFAKERGLTIVSKDADFRQLSFRFGFPPKIIWGGLGNCTTAEVESAILSHAPAIKSFLADPEASFLVLSAGN